MTYAFFVELGVASMTRKHTHTRRRRTQLRRRAVVHGAEKHIMYVREN